MKPEIIFLHRFNRREFLRSSLQAAAGLAGGLWTPGRARAASTINNRTIAGGSQNAISMINSTWARRISLPASWNKVRVGIRCHLADTGADLTGGPLLAWGLCSGTSNQYGDATTTHFVGCVLTAGSGTYSYISGATRYYFMSNYYPFGRKRVGTTNTDTAGTFFTGSGFGNATIIQAGAQLAQASRQVMFLDITKGSPNYTLALPMWNYSGVGDISATDFLLFMGQASPAIPTNYTPPPNSQTLAVNEGTDGALNAVNVYWNRTDAALEVCDVAVAVLS